MCSRVVLVLLFTIVSVHSQYLMKKFCNDDASPNMCDVYNVMLEPCADEHKYCTIKRTKRYTLSIDFLPKFSASKLNISMTADDTNSGAFDKVLKGSSDACRFLTCPVEAQTRRVFDVDFSLGKSFPAAKFPVKVKLFNNEDASQSCCFTFNVKILK